MIDLELSDAQETMSKTVSFFKSQLAKVRTGRASAGMLDSVSIEAYGQKSPINQVATVNIPDARSIIVQPWDKSLLQEIEKAIQVADLGLNPQNDGTIIRVPVPPLTEERRKEFVKLCKKYSEDAKVAIRNIRRDKNDSLKKYEKDKDISEDERKDGENQVQKLTDKFISIIDNVLSDKETELMED